MNAVGFVRIVIGDRVGSGGYHASVRGSGSDPAAPVELPYGISPSMRNHYLVGLTRYIKFRKSADFDCPPGIAMTA